MGSFISIEKEEETTSCDVSKRGRFPQTFLEKSGTYPTPHWGPGTGKYYRMTYYKTTQQNIKCVRLIWKY